LSSFNERFSVSSGLVITAAAAAAAGDIHQVL
jgi:hypothetical protein